LNAKLYVSRIGGSLAAPPSKSAAHRAVLCAGLATGKSRITNLDYSKDIRATLGAVQQLGAKITKEDAGLLIEGCGGRFATVTRPVDCGESGSTLRFLIPVFSLTAQRIRFVGAPRLFERPQSIYQRLFIRQGLSFVQKDGITIFGALRPGEFTLPGDVSSQFISGLLFAAPLMEGESTLRILPPFESQSYVGLTLDALRRFGVKAQASAAAAGGAVFRVAGGQRYTAHELAVEGDYSQAAFAAVLGTVAGNGVTVTGLDPDSHQGDKAILKILRSCGAKFAVQGDTAVFERSLLHAQEIDLADCPDLGPILIAMACFCQGTTVIRHARRLRLKESDRIAAMEQELSKMGAEISSDEDNVTVRGTALHAAAQPLGSHNDHRVAMSVAVAALGAGVPALITGAEAVQKSWPGFFEAMRALGAKVELTDGER
jgi:3-phosphoshikimate 1-carboxyvinyltransferase